MLRRFLTALPVASLLALALPQAGLAAGAFPTDVSSPGDESALIARFPGGVQAPQQITFSGTAFAPDNEPIDLSCFRNGTRIVKFASTTVDTGGANGGASANGTFSVAVDPASTTDAAFPVVDGWCQLRAVPAGATTLDPGYAGPKVFLGRDYDDMTAGRPTDYISRLPFGSFGYVELGSFGGCGLVRSYTQNPSTLALSPGADRLFNCNGWAADNNVPDTAAAMTVDGRNVLSPYYAALYYPTDSGLPSSSHSLEMPSSKSAIVREQTGFARCAATVLPVAKATCGGISEVPVKLERRIDVTQPGDVEFGIAGGKVRITDVWRATDGRAHELALQMEEDYNGNKDLGLVNFGGVSPSLPLPAAPTATSIPIPADSGPVSWIAQTDRNAAAGPMNPFGTTTVYPRPAALIWGAANNAFSTPETFTVPGCGTTVRRRIYLVSEYIAVAPQLITRAEEDAVTPDIVVNQPASAITTESSATITGRLTRVTDETLVKIGDTTVPVGADGSFTASVPLAPGVNTLIARATRREAEAEACPVTITRNPRPKAKVTFKKPATLRFRKGVARLSATLSGAGTVSARATVKRGGKTVVVGAGLGKARKAGRVTIGLNLTKAGAPLLRRAGAKGLKVTLALTGSVAGQDPGRLTARLTATR